MRFALIADTFPPLRTSGAVQLRDLSRELVRQGHELTVLLPDASLSEPWRLSDFEGVSVLRLRAPQTKDIGFVRRTIAELLMPYAMARNLARSSLASVRWDGVIWYAPSIFHGPLAARLKRASGCPGYLIIRDIFPEWAVDMGLMGRGLPYWFFRAVANYQYAVADVIGVQTEGNCAYFAAWQQQRRRHLEVLQNWLGPAGTEPCSIVVRDTVLAGRKILVYAGNMGVAQGVDAMIELAERLRSRSDVGFVFVGRGSEVERLKTIADSRGLDNVLFCNEIDPDEIPALYAQCYAGMVCLDPRHRTHNIPGKFLTYMQSGLPVIARVNAGNDLVALIEREGVGVVTESVDGDALASAVERLLASGPEYEAMQKRCRALFAERYAAGTAVQQVVRALSATS